MNITNLREEYEYLIISVVLLIVAISLLYMLIVAYTEILNNPFLFALYYFELLFLLLFSMAFYGKHEAKK